MCKDSQLQSGACAIERERAIKFFQKLKFELRDQIANFQLTTFTEMVDATTFDEMVLEQERLQKASKAQLHSCQNSQALMSNKNTGIVNNNKRKWEDNQTTKFRIRDKVQFGRCKQQIKCFNWGGWATLNVIDVPQLKMLLRRIPRHSALANPPAPTYAEKGQAEVFVACVSEDVNEHEFIEGTIYLTHNNVHLNDDTKDCLIRVTHTRWANEMQLEIYKIMYCQDEQCQTIRIELSNILLVN